ncbi:MULTISPECIES: substrate-binding periplasmic protein [Pseudomonas]|uniref:ABC transporter substrate-binding protein n=1 Tax=Pseudomonas protegens TaxID=380021 RepID=A0A9Q6N965_9PSED|nr:MULTISPECIES: transporter substrate-binding domain-containing protein [Pseudomonas]MBS7559239.1 transporter substrate-binding domain-containing protein [Pseudomonas sp. RC4D1]MBW8356132.1 transporter substrate-binding domain-containing protein [Pseudomonas sp.]MCY7262449.1 transporter substrate-binding domain-containing protein [Pseudomonas protegens]MDP9506595.1 transporter substrate-binding domain-containing protein [Pseudomonas protegens]MDP9511756.1 transporter substrate-binding domain-
MDVCRVLLVLLVAWSCCSVRAGELQAPSGQIRIASEVWSEYTEADGDGLAWDILREVFEPVGITIERYSVPYTRSVGLVQRGEVDAQVGAYRDESPGVLYPHWNYDTDHIYALGLASSPELSPATLGSYRLVWVRGYKYQDYLPNVRRYNEIRRRVGILPMLLYSRADYYIDAQTEIDYVLSQAQDPSQFKRTHLAELPLYLGFASNPRGREMRELYDQRMAQLVSTGRLRPIFERWKQPYPFDGSPRPAVR